MKGTDGKEGEDVDESCKEDTDADGRDNRGTGAYHRSGTCRCLMHMVTHRYSRMASKFCAKFHISYFAKFG